MRLIGGVGGLEVLDIVDSSNWTPTNREVTKIVNTYRGWMIKDS